MTATIKTNGHLKHNLFALTCGAVFLALGVLLPEVFHLALGQAGGKLFLPMHLSVLLAGCFLGWQYGLVIGTVTPLLSFLLTGMPPVPTLFLMMAELAFYGLASGIFNRRLRSREHGSWLRIVGSVLLAQLCGRAAYLGVLFLLGTLLGLPKIPGPEAVFAAAVTGWPGILFQLALVPVLVRLLHKMKMGVLR
ncbi:MAG: ECF transporter S component [Oscillospiraceae bacterium]|nr:ECF transporter S component [Oscillospiraceae bacterium]